MMVRLRRVYAVLFTRLPRRYSSRDCDERRLHSDAHGKGSLSLNGPELGPPPTVGGSPSDIRRTCNVRLWCYPPPGGPIVPVPSWQSLHLQ
jgi:hypothetical protein